MTDELKSVCRNYPLLGDYISASPYGSGHINDTFRVVTGQGSVQARYIFQRINQSVFKNLDKLMENIRRVTRHQQFKLAAAKDASRRSLTLLHPRDGNTHFVDERGGSWRCYPFIEGSNTFDIVESREQARQTAKAFGQFQKDLADLDGQRLNETIPDFHNTPKRFKDFNHAVNEDSYNRAASVKDEIRFVLERESVTRVLLDLHARGEIPERITHNDAKLNNVLLDKKTGEALCVIDLDTVMPGLALYDFGDMVRSCTCRAAEDEQDLSQVSMELPVYKALVDGYLQTAGDMLNSAERSHLAFSGKLITFETGLRFLTDYLRGDVYFKTHRQAHNLDRCRTQFKLVTSIEEQEGPMNDILKPISTLSA